MADEKKYSFSLNDNAAYAILCIAIAVVLCSFSSCIANTNQANLVRDSIQQGKQ